MPEELFLHTYEFGHSPDLAQKGWFRFIRKLNGGNCILQGSVKKIAIEFRMLL